MIKQSVTYTDYNGAERTEDFCFNLSRNDLVKLNNKYLDEGGLEIAFNKAYEANDVGKAYEIFTDMIISAYGEKSNDGKYFNKTPELSEKFANSAAFDALFDLLTSDSATLVAFFNGMVPAKLSKQM